jgi:hypothetical protein
MTWITRPRTPCPPLPAGHSLRPPVLRNLLAASGDLALNQFKPKPRRCRQMEQPPCGFSGALTANGIAYGVNPVEAVAG